MFKQKNLLIAFTALIFILISIGAVNANETDFISDDNTDINFLSEDSPMMNRDPNNYIYVNSSSESLDPDGSQGNPYKTIKSAVGNSSSSGNFYIAQGNYDENRITFKSGAFTFTGEEKDEVIISSSGTGHVFETTSIDTPANFTNLTFKNINTGTGSFAVIKIGGNQDVTIDKCNFYNCSGKSGAIWFYTKGTGTISNCEIANHVCSVTAGSVFYLSGTEGVYNIKNTKIENVNSSFIDTAYIYGVIYVYGGNPQVNIENCNISKVNLNAKSVLYSNSKELNILNSNIYQNNISKTSTGYHGESIIFVNRGQTNIKESSIYDNIAGTNVFLH